jgi:transposase
MDTKATVNVGEYSRRGRSRGFESVKAWDHDMRSKKKLVPGGILEPLSGKASLFFTGSCKTSDFIVDGLLMWWRERKQALSDIKHLVINMDNGPECSGRRSQFLQRMVEFVDEVGLSVRIIYYPPYHSKYNGIERYWAGLEKSWNGYLLSSVTDVLNRAANFFWKGVRTSVGLIDGVYKKGIRVCGKNRAKLEARIERSEKLPFYDITIRPKTVH